MYKHCNENDYQKYACYFIHKMIYFATENRKRRMKGVCAMTQREQWEGFSGENWRHSIDVRDFIQENYTPYEGDESFLEGPTEATNTLWEKLQELQKEERAKGGVLDMETEVVSGLTAYGPGYISEETKDLEKVVGLQTDKPLKRAFMPYGGIKMAEQACTTYGYQPSEMLHEIFTKYHIRIVFIRYLCTDIKQEYNVSKLHFPEFSFIQRRKNA